MKVNQAINYLKTLDPNLELVSSFAAIIGNKSISGFIPVTNLAQVRVVKREGKDYMEMLKSSDLINNGPVWSTVVCIDSNDSPCVNCSSEVNNETKI